MEHNLDRVKQLARQIKINDLNGVYNELVRFVDDMVAKEKDAAKEAVEEKKMERKTTPKKVAKKKKDE